MALTRSKFYSKIPNVGRINGRHMHGFDHHHPGFHHSSHSRLFWNWTLSVVLLEMTEPDQTVIQGVDLAFDDGDECVLFWTGISNVSGNLKGENAVKLSDVDDPWKHE